MTNLVFTPKWNSGINQVEVYEPITGGTNGNANLATRQLAENIFFLKDDVIALSNEINIVYKKKETDELLKTKTNLIDSTKTISLSSNKMALTKADNSITEIDIPMWNQSTTGNAATATLATKAMTADIATLANKATTADTATISNSANKLSTPRTFSYTGDAIGSLNFDGSANVSAALTLSNTGVSASTYTKLTVDAKGRVISGTSIVASDIPNLDIAKITTGVLPIARGGTGTTSVSEIKTVLSLNNVDNTTDLNKPISTATQQYVDDKQMVGVYNPNFSSLTGITSVTGTNISYIKQDKLVTVIGTLTLDISTIGAISFKMSLPLTSNFANNNQAGGIILASDVISGFVESDISKIFAITANAKATGSQKCGFQFTYIII